MVIVFLIACVQNGENETPPRSNARGRLPPLLASRAPKWGSVAKACIIKCELQLHPNIKCSSFIMITRVSTTSGNQGELEGIFPVREKSENWTIF